MSNRIPIALDVRDVRANATLSAVGDSLNVESFTARASGYQLRGTLSAEGASSRGALLITKGSLSLGVELVDGKTNLKVVGAAEWFRDRQ